MYKKERNALKPLLSLDACEHGNDFLKPKVSKVVDKCLGHL